MNSRYKLPVATQGQNTTTITWVYFFTLLDARKSFDRTTTQSLLITALDHTAGTLAKH
jgi:hypothetical protein